MYPNVLWPCGDIHVWTYDFWLPYAIHYIIIITYFIILYLFLILVKNNQLWTDNFYFVVAADTQFGYIKPPVKRDSKDWKIEMDKAILAIDKINNLSPRPQFLVVCGDLVNEMPCS